MSLSSEDSENLRRIADALDPPPYRDPTPSGPSIPRPLRAIGVGAMAAFLIAIPAGLIGDIFSRSVGNIVFWVVVGLGILLGASIED